MQKSGTELLAPAGSYEAFRAGLLAGADAFYLGGVKFGARAFADNFTEEVLLKTLDEAHTFGKKIYLTVNTLMKEAEIGELAEFLRPFYAAGLDAVIVQDVGALRMIRREFPDLAVHASTQMTVTGWEGAALLESLGVVRVVPARELSLAEIAQIRAHTGLEIECFVHGALCCCYSGQCLMSSFFGGRSGNRGRCAQPCRLPYTVLERGRPCSDPGHAYALNTKDICLIDHVAELTGAGITSFKIEGRMKRPEYTAGVVSVYRKMLDRFEQEGRPGPADPGDRAFLEALFNRDGFSRSYYYTHNGPEMMALKNEKQSGRRMKQAEEAYETVRREILSREIKKPVSGIFTILEESAPDGREQAKNGFTAVFQISDGETSVRVSSEDPVPAQNRPLDEETVRRQLGKTGGTPYVFESLEIRLAEGVFLTMKQLNELRRAAFAAFAEASLARYRRDSVKTWAISEGDSDKTQAISEGDSGIIQTASEGKSDIHRAVSETETDIQRESCADDRLGLWVMAETAAQFDAVKDLPEIEGFYLPLRQVEKLPREMQNAFRSRLWITLPYITRQEEGRAGADPAAYRKTVLAYAAEGWHFLVRSLEDVAFLIREGFADRIRLDDRMYTFNTESRMFWRDLGVRETTVPAELNKKEIQARDNRDSELVVYGRTVLMVSAQCIRKNYGACTASFGQMTLKDRKGMEFPVSFDCDMCYNIIYNSVPVSLLSILPQVQSCGVKRIRAALTLEGKKEALRLVRFAADVLKSRAAVKDEIPGKEISPKEDFPYTRGHFFRGVE